MRRILVANRGEIAVRIIRACRHFGVESVAVYSDADRAALHVRMADRAMHLGGSPPDESYLNVEKLIAAANSSGADAIHPGYGFLSENAAFAQRVIDEGLTWIGPPPQAMAQMGDKIAARKLMRTSRVPIVPGSDDPIDDPESALVDAKRAGFPILLKAVAGGGGKGMRRVDHEADWLHAFESASREAERAFGDGRMYWEKRLIDPRHIEIQILAGQDGQTLALFERECSIQRRHQKLVEESPSTFITDDLRERMSRAAIAAARACGYVSAGTVEFLVDADRNFYFLEMNTRLQVEHPVTELVTGIDLVIEQFKISAGQKWAPPPLSNRPSGHAIEFRIYAEDAENDFLPSPGVLTAYREPQGPGVRVDSGVYSGFEIPLHYDPMIAKLVVWGSDRSQAIARAACALEEYRIGGVHTTIAFHRRVLEQSEFHQGNTTIDFISRHMRSEAVSLPPDPDLNGALALAAALHAERDVRHSPIGDESQVVRRWVLQSRTESTQRWPVAHREAGRTS